MKSKLLIILVIFCGCNPAQHLARFVKRHPELLKKDTIRVIDTIVVKGVTKDSTFYYRTSDTVIIQKDKLEIKYFFNNNDSTVFIQGKCKGDTIYKDKIIYVNSIEVEKVLTWKQRIKIWLVDNWWWILLLFSIIGIAIRFVIKFYTGK